MKKSRDELKPQLSDFGANVRKIRIQQGLTQEELAGKADLAPRVLQKIEAGHTNILVTTAIRLQKALDCDWRKLMDI